MSIHGFLSHQLTRPSIYTTFRLRYEVSKRDCVVKVQSHSKRHYQASLKTTLSNTISHFTKLRRSNLNTVNQLLPKVSGKEALESVSFLVTFERSKFPKIIRIIVKTVTEITNRDPVSLNLSSRIVKDQGKYSSHRKSVLDSLKIKNNHRLVIGNLKYQFHI